MEKKKGKTIIIITIFIVCFVLSLVMFMQFKIVRETDLELLETMRQSELVEELAMWNQKYEDTNAQYKETIDTIQEYKNNIESNEETEKLLNEELLEEKMKMGVTDVNGQGIQITLKDVENYEIPKINSYDLLLIVNSLKLAGAEAITISDQRIINNTDIVDIQFDSDSYIKINGERILGPYIIKAIGDSRYLESELLGTGGYINRMQKIGQDAEINKLNSINILKYDKQISSKYVGN